MKPIPNIWEDFSTVRNRVKEQWKSSPKHHDNISPQLKQKTQLWIENQRKVLSQN
jgi:hypothetical protein